MQAKPRRSLQTSLPFPHYGKGTNFGTAPRPAPIYFAVRETSRKMTGRDRSLQKNGQKHGSWNAVCIVGASFPVMLCHIQPNSLTPNSLNLKRKWCSQECICTSNTLWQKGNQQNAAEKEREKWLPKSNAHMHRWLPLMRWFVCQAEPLDHSSVIP